MSRSYLVNHFALDAPLKTGKTPPMSHRAFHTVSLAISSRNAQLYMSVNAGDGGILVPRDTPHPVSDVASGFDLPERERAVIERLLDSCQDYADHHELDIADTVERIGLRMTQAYLERARED